MCCKVMKGKQASRTRHAPEQQTCLQAVKSVLQEAYGDKAAVTDELVQCILQPGLEVGCKMCLCLQRPRCADCGWHVKSLVPQSLSCHMPQAALAAARGSFVVPGLTGRKGSYIFCGCLQPGCSHTCSLPLLLALASAKCHTGCSLEQLMSSWTSSAIAVAHWLRTSWRRCPAQ